MYPAHGCFRWIVKLCVVVTALLQLLHALRSTCAQIIESAKHDGFSRANFCAGRNESALLSIVTERTFECTACVWQRRRPAIDHTKRARHHAIAAAVANIILHEDGANFRAHD